MYFLIISFIVANCVLTVFNKDNELMMMILTLSTAKRIIVVRFSLLLAGATVWNSLPAEFRDLSVLMFLGALLRVLHRFASKFIWRSASTCALVVPTTRLFTA